MSLKPVYDTTDRPIDISNLDNNAAGTWFVSDEVDNTTFRYSEVEVRGIISTGTVATGGGVIAFYPLRSLEGTDYDLGIDVNNADLTTWGTTSNTHVGGEFSLTPAKVVQVDETDDSIDLVIPIFNIASYFDGVMPPFWKVLIFTGVALGNSVNNILEYRGFNWEDA